MRISARRIWFPLFLATLWMPLVAVLASPQFSIFLRAIHHDPASFEAERNRLRLETPLWNAAVAFYNRSLYALGVSGRPGAAEIGSDGWIFLGDLLNNNFSQALGRRVLDDVEVARWVETQNLQADWLSAHGIPYVFIVAPAKWSIYPERLPRWAARLHPTHSVDRILDAGHSLPMIDLRSALRQAKAHADTYSALDSHWTDFGAWVAWQAISAQLNHSLPEFPPLRVPTLLGIDVVDGPGEFESMLGISAINRVARPVLAEPLSDFVVVNTDGSTQLMPGGRRTDLLDLPRTTRNENASNRLRVLILRDSTGNALSPLMQEAFYMTYQVDHSLAVPAHRPNLVGLVEEIHPDLVLWIMTERYFNEPLGDIAYWRAIRAYECNSDASLGVWRDASSSRTFSVERDPVKSSLWKVSAAAIRQSKVMRIMVKASAPGALAIEGANGAVSTHSLDYVKGRNELFIEVPGSSTTLMLNGGADQNLAVVEVELRAVEVARCLPPALRTH